MYFKPNNSTIHILCLSKTICKIHRTDHVCKIMHQKVTYKYNLIESFKPHHIPDSIVLNDYYDTFWYPE